MWLPDFKDKLNIENLYFKNIFLDYIRFFLSADTNYNLQKGDATSAMLSKSVAKTGRLIISLKSNHEYFVFHELILLSEIYSDLSFKFDSNNVAELIVIEGSIKNLLIVERLVLNLYSRLLAIYNEILKYEKVIKKFQNNVKLMGTRKCILSGIDKLPLKHTQCLTHRLNLNHGIMFKDNHAKLYDKYSFKKEDFILYDFVEFEYDDYEMFLNDFEFLQDFFQNEVKGGVLLDNFSIDLLKNVLDKIKHTQRNFFIEASGGIKIQNLLDYDIVGLDAISTSAFFTKISYPDLSATLLSK